jgi:hypothetical protein
MRWFSMPKSAALVLHEHVILFEAAFIEQDGDPFAGRQLAFGVLGFDPPLTAAEAGLFAFLLQCFDHILHSPGLLAKRVSYVLSEVLDNRPNFNGKGKREAISPLTRRIAAASSHFRGGLLTGRPVPC